MSTITKSNIATIRSDVEAALAAVAKKHGLTITVGRITYDDSSFRCKVEGEATVSNSAVKQSSKLGLATVLGDKFNEKEIYISSSLGLVKFVDYRPSSYKYPVIVEQVQTTKRFKLSTLQAKALVNNEAKKCLDVLNAQ
jgi:hypothetical protein